MPKIHCLTVGQGDCTLIQHGSGRVSMIDICGGNSEDEDIELLIRSILEDVKGNFRMCNSPTNPLKYLKENGFTEIWRYISTHPDMDHLDGFNALMNQFSVYNFWDQGARKEKPNFCGTPYREEDWDRYVKVRDGREDGTQVIKVQQGSTLKFANEDDQAGHGDCITICAPSSRLVEQCNQAQSFNDASYIISYNANGGKVVLAGDADDNAWQCAIDRYPNLLRNVGFLLAPHHGRDSGRDRSFLSHLNPRFTLLECAPSKYLAYDAWRNRSLAYCTQNQCGNLVVDANGDDLRIYIENEDFANKEGGDVKNTNEQGYFLLGNF